ncbi:abhydrolase domain-containing protein [Cordyceps javanica]|uniref:Abhydrolase domain-containing protein n=1 Tax=Cordyceps javanica TaxID=43265 RepID=A0A545V791_9HYPO|nr:abhydrolase domain-containing protein [Cordyceps javanica]TQW09241.1 abhydrolase domain-containing protein [Cordyceps javanica]
MPSNKRNNPCLGKRLATQQSGKPSIQKWIIYSAKTGGGDGRQGAASPPTVERPTYFCRWTGSARKEALERLQAAVVRNCLANTLDAKLLTSVTQHNTVRAMMRNAAYFNLTLDLLREEILSPFNLAGPAILDLATLPPSLRPTALQRQIVHHPWIDLCPVASLRDAMLLSAGLYDEDELCHDLFAGSASDSEQQVGMVVWGDSWDPSAYEMSRAIICKWRWLFAGCSDLLQSTNHWRLKRNEELIGSSPADDAL